MIQEQPRDKKEISITWTKDLIAVSKNDTSSKKHSHED
jgi:hypothetical protein